jgi:hypothetical protein
VLEGFATFHCSKSSFPALFSPLAVSLELRRYFQSQR